MQKGHGDVLGVNDGFVYADFVVRVKLGLSPVVLGQFAGANRNRQRAYFDFKETFLRLSLFY